jgi:hypothetical protein
VAYLQHYAAILYPIIGAVALLLIAFGVWGAWKAKEGNAMHRAALRGELVRLMRRYPAGLTAEQAASDLKADPPLIAQILEEMATEGTAQRGFNSMGVRVYLVRGL